MYIIPSSRIFRIFQALLSSLGKASRWAEALDLLRRTGRNDVISYSAVISALEPWRNGAHPWGERGK